MGAVLNRLLATLLLVCCGVVATGAAASAAACPEKTPPVNQQTKRADAVFTGTIVERSEPGNDVTYTVAVDEIFKGNVGEQATVSTPARLKDCGLPALGTGDEYVIFATADGEQFTTTSDSGTTLATDAHVDKVQTLLGPPTSPVPPEPVEATFTMVADEATSIERLVAPGLALVIVGLLGLALVAAIGRRKA